MIISPFDGLVELGEMVMIGGGQLSLSSPFSAHPAA